MSTKDIEMTDASSVKPENPGTEVANLIIADLKKNISLLEKSVTSKDIRLVSRVLRSLSLVRRRITSSVLRKIINQTFSSEADHSKKLNLLNSFQHLSDSTPETQESTMEITSTTNILIPEVEVYLHLLVVIFLIDKKSFQQAVTLSSNLVERIQEFNRRTLNPLSAKAYFYYSRSYEAVGKLEDIRVTASLKHNEESQATLLNLLLRNYLAYNLYDQAEKLISKIQFREDTANSNEHARYLYYQGRIKSVQLEYTDAYRCLLGAMRKAPQNSARGFRLAVNKLACIVQCLIGEIPERSMFRQPDLRKGLVPYLQLTQAVRVGDLAAFHRVINQYGETFKTDKTFTLIQRLRHNVIKTGLRKINLSYSRISFEDICTKLHLESVEDAEFIVAKVGFCGAELILKAIRDGVINATIDHSGRFIQSKEQTDVYSTQEPQAAFHRRIMFCLNTHNEAVKAMRFPPDAHKPSLESAKERREREQEIAKNLADEDEYD